MVGNCLALFAAVSPLQTPATVFPIGEKHTRKPGWDPSRPGAARDLICVPLSICCIFTGRLLMEAAPAVPGAVSPLYSFLLCCVLCCQVLIESNICVPKSPSYLWWILSKSKPLFLRFKFVCVVGKGVRKSEDNLQDLRVDSLLLSYRSLGLNSWSQAWL